MKDYAVFTIVTKSYLPQARTLGDSIRQLHPDLAFHVILADETQGMIELGQERYSTEEVKNIGIPSHRDMAFRYDLVEFCTAVKPYCFEYLFQRFGYQRIVYLDPDIYIYSSLEPVFGMLEDASVVLTPHITKIDCSDEGTKPQDDYLRCGTYNLGFIALRRSEEATALLSWWKSRTRDQAYADFADGLYVDQKWANLIPCFSKRVCVARHPGLNVAHWNMHERELTVHNGAYYVDGLPLVFYHFSGFDPHTPEGVSRPHARGPVTLHERPVYGSLYETYRTRLLGNVGSDAQSYAYSRFQNGVSIYSFQRRLYRTLREHDLEFGDPFSTAPQSYYDLLRANKLLITNGAVEREYRSSDVAGSAKKLAALRKGMVLLKRVIGIRRYHILMRVLSTLSRPEEQTFLFENLHLDFPIRFRS